MTTPPESSENSFEPDEQDPEESLWDHVYAARESFYRAHFGEFPDDILKIGHLFGVWPGGGLYVIRATALGGDVWVYTTFGLTNPDMPASVRVTDVDVERDDEGRVVQSSANLQRKVRADVPDGMAGYGYEMLIVTRQNTDWPLGFLQWAVGAEILNDAGILKRVEAYDGLTVEEVRVGENDSVNVLIAKAQPPLPAETILPNGRMSLLVATVITDDEMRWSMEHGRDALLARLHQGGVGQFSVRGRPSVIS
jgi:hypothetical protein